MAVSAETLVDTRLNQENYAQSLSRLRAVGHLIVSQEIKQNESIPEIQAYADFTSSVREMIKTDEQFRDWLDIDDKIEHAVVDGKARDIDGVALVDMIAVGKQVSESAARQHPEFAAQAIRDNGDLQTAITADELLPGESWIVLSMEPKQELKEYPETYRRLGYREGLTYIQWYSKASQNRMVAGSFSVDLSDEAAWRGVLAEEGIVIPEGESPNTWIRHGIKRQYNPEQTEDFVRSLRNRYYERLGVNHRRHSASEYVTGQEPVMRAIFKEYCTAIGLAAATGENNETMQGLAAAMLKTDLSRMKAEVRSQLIRVANSKSFSDELSRTMESIIRYSVVEELRQGLPNFIGKVDNDRSHQSRWLGFAGLEVPPDIIHNYLAGRVEAGIRAGRTYGGCAGQVELSTAMVEVDEFGYTNNLNNPQEAYGGRSNPESSVGKLKIGECIIASCPTRPNKVLVGGCGICIGRCQKLFDRGKDPTKILTLFNPTKTEADKETKITPINKTAKAEAAADDKSEKKLAA